MSSNHERLRRKNLLRHAEQRRNANASACLEEVIATFIGKPYAELRKLVDGPINSCRIYKEGRTYTVDVTVVLDNNEGAIRVIFDIDDGGLGQTAPISTWELVRPDEVFQRSL